MESCLAELLKKFNELLFTILCSVDLVHRKQENNNKKTFCSVHSFCLECLLPITSIEILCTFQRYLKCSATWEAFSATSNFSTFLEPLSWPCLSHRNRRSPPFVPDSIVFALQPHSDHGHVTYKAHHSVKYRTGI